MLYEVITMLHPQLPPIDKDLTRAALEESLKKQVMDRLAEKVV